MAAQQRKQRRFQRGFQPQYEADAHHALDDLPPPGRLRIKLYIAPLNGLTHQNAQRTAQHGIAVFYRRGQIFRIHIRGPGVQLHVQHRPQRHDGRKGEDRRDNPRLFLALLENRVQHQHQHQRAAEAYRHIGGGMYAQIHAGKAHQHHENDTHRSHPCPFDGACQASHHHRHILTVPTGERIACGSGPGAFYNGKLRIPHPRTRHLTGNFQNLIQHRAQQSGGQQIVAVALVMAPKHRHRRRNKQPFTAKIGDDGEKSVQNRVTDALQRIQKTHGNLSRLFCFG